MYTKIIIGVDPAVTHGVHSDETGIIVVGKGADHLAYVIDDLSIKGPPSLWIERIVKGYHHYNASCVVAEVNQGGDLVEALLKTADPSIRFKAVRAVKSKQNRAAPIAMLYEQGKVFHTKCFPDLEHQMCLFTPDGGKGGKSPDRLDALVWALTELMKSREAIPPRFWEINLT